MNIEATLAQAGGHQDTDAAQKLAYRRAQRLVRALRGWYFHLAVYLAVNTLLWTQYLVIRGASGVAWPVYPTLFWGLGLTIHGLTVWVRVSRRGRDWETEKIREFMAREAR